MENYKKCLGSTEPDRKGHFRHISAQNGLNGCQRKKLKRLKKYKYTIVKQKNT
jgi:hypothetical protein